MSLPPPRFYYSPRQGWAPYIPSLDVRPQPLNSVTENEQQRLEWASWAAECCVRADIRVPKQKNQTRDQAIQTEIQGIENGGVGDADPRRRPVATISRWSPAPAGWGDWD
jgi:hypothetical protein